MRVLLVPHSYAPAIGGVEAVVAELASHLRTEGHGAAVLTDAYPGAPDREARGGIPVWRARFTPRGGSTAFAFYRGLPRTVRQVRDAVRAMEPDVVHIHVTAANAWYGRLAARMAGAPVVVTTHGSHGGALNARGLADEESLCRAAAAVTHCSCAAREQFRRKHPRLADPGDVIYNGVDVRAAASALPDPETVGAVVYAGRLTRGKGVDMLLRAWRGLGRRGQDLVVCGDGPEREQLRSLAADLGLTGVRWMGAVPRDRVRAALRSAAAFCLPSHEEGFPMGVLDAMAARCPVVATAVGGIPEQIEDGVHGWLPAPDEPALRRALGECLADPCEAARRADEAYMRVATEFAWSAVLPRYLAVYRRTEAPCLAA